MRRSTLYSWTRPWLRKGVTPALAPASPRPRVLQGGWGLRGGSASKRRPIARRRPSGTASIRRPPTRRS
eukprot:11556639-Alexandrium_andersonii.AAC.1